MSNHSNPNSTSNNPPSLIPAGEGRYHLSEPASLDDVYNLMLSILELKYLRPDTLSSPEDVRRFLQVKLANLEHEVFSVVFLDSQHRVICYEEMFRVLNHIVIGGSDSISMAQQGML